MDLKEFIQETISAIADATSELQERYTEKEILINPPSALNNHTTYSPESRNYTYRRVQDIEFDVAVSASSEKSVGGKGGIKVLSVELGAQGEIAKADEHVSRVHFKIPITLRPSDKEKENRERKEEADRAFQENRQPKSGPYDWMG
ncbi:trypco2 family protein [Albibacillus kandeliae]|uniref:trypco2 family protein n=1 Tax=Albibacillus kandeliae TaxID=2174228 RepID=UPI000D68F16B|nr:trypco2 family protein [Albibacillus kandeliae]